MKSLKMFFLIIFVLMTSPTRSGAEAITQIRYGVEPTYPPFESKAPDGSLQGFDIDLGNEICRRLNAQCVWIESNFDGIIPALLAKKFDVINSSLSATAERAEHIAFTDKLYAPTEGLVVPDRSNITTAITAGRLDAALAVAVQADLGFLKTPQGRQFVFAKGPALYDPAIFGAGISLGVRKQDNVLLDKLNAAIADIRKDGTYAKIANKYFDIYGK